MSEFAEWDSFYVIVGSAVGALIGLQFIVMTLIASRPQVRVAEAGAAFVAPTVVHFSAVLFLAALLRAPWDAITVVAILWGLVGLSGVAYTVVIILRMRSQSVYRPELEDWLFHALLPLLAYAALGVAMVVAFFHVRGALFTVGGGALLLLFIGIHNAWDNVAFNVFGSADHPEVPQPEQQEPAASGEPSSPQ